MTAAMETLQTKTKGEIIHQGVTAMTDIPGLSTRAGARRASEDGAGTSKRILRKPYSRPTPPREPDEEKRTRPTRAPTVHPETLPEGGWVHRMLTDMQRTLNELVTMVSTMNTQLQHERQRANNLELRVESMQKARMQGLRAQTLPVSATTPSSGQTSHTGGITDGPLTF